MTPGRGGKMFEVLTIRRHDLIVVPRKHHDRSVDDIVHPGCREKLAGRTAERFVKGTDVHTLDGLRQSRLARTATPYLAEHTCVGDG